MTARLRKLFNQLAEAFWLVPGAMVLGGVLLAIGLLGVDRSGSLPSWVSDSNWFYNGGGTGARTLLGAIAGSTIGVAGTVFSITIAALSLAAGQMGPRLLRNFTQDRGVQIRFGAFLGTFSYALMVLRSVRTQQEGPFTPHLALTAGILFAFACVATPGLFRRPHGEPHQRRYRDRTGQRRHSFGDAGRGDARTAGSAPADCVLG